MSKRLFVGNLSYETTEDSLRTAFEADGRQVTDVHLVIDRETGRPRGFGFVGRGYGTTVRRVGPRLAAVVCLALVLAWWPTSRELAISGGSAAPRTAGVHAPTRAADPAMGANNFINCEGCELSIGHTGALAPGLSVAYGVNWTGNGTCTAPEYECYPTAPCRLVPGQDYLISVQNLLDNDVSTGAFLAGGLPNFLTSTSATGSSFTMALNVSTGYTLDVGCSGSDTHRPLWWFSVKRDGQSYPVEFVLTCSKCMEI